MSQQPVNYNPANPHVAFNQTLPAAPQMMVIPRVTKAMAFQQEWQTDLGDCFQSKDCCYAYFCFPCYMCRVAAVFEESCWASCYVGMPAYRAMFRARKGIKGSLLSDCCTTAFCMLCSAIQLMEEQEKRGGAF